MKIVDSLGWFFLDLKNSERVMNSRSKYCPVQWNHPMDTTGRMNQAAKDFGTSMNWKNVVCPYEEPTV